MASLDWTHIEQTFGPHVWRTAYRILRDYEEASDCYQDVFLELYEQSRRQELVPRVALFQWLTTRRAIDRLRKMKIQQSKLPVVRAESAVGRELPPHWSVEFDELIAALRAELARLPPNQAEAFWLSCVEGVSYDEIASQLRLAKSHIGVLVHRARAKLKLALAALLPDQFDEE